MALPEEQNWYALLARDDLAGTFREWCETVAALQQLIVRRSQNDFKCEPAEKPAATADDAGAVDLKRLLALSRELERKLNI